MKNNFLKTCSACDGTGIYEEPFCTFENETHYRELECGCEDGKEFDFPKYWEEIEIKKAEMKHWNEAVEIRLQLARKYCNENNESMTFQAIKSMIEAESKVNEIDEYIAELENIEV